MNGRYLHLPPTGTDESHEMIRATFEADLESVCSCGGDPDTCPENQAVIAEITADDERGGHIS